MVSDGNGLVFNLCQWRVVDGDVRATDEESVVGLDGAKVSERYELQFGELGAVEDPGEEFVTLGREALADGCLLPGSGRILPAVGGAGDLGETSGVVAEGVAVEPRFLLVVLADVEDNEIAQGLGEDTMLKEQFLQGNEN